MYYLNQHIKRQFSLDSGFSGTSAGKESACNAGDPSLIPGSGRSPGEGIGYPLRYSWASQAAQRVKNLPAMQETWVRSLGWEDPLEKRKATHSSIQPWRIPLTGYSMGSQSRTWQSNLHHPWWALANPGWEPRVFGKSMHGATSHQVTKPCQAS